MEPYGNEKQHETQDGFRLRYLEVYNWGTFHQQIWRMTPNLSTALLTGANGSGKSTLVDALLTLLVPGRQRKYNQASGSERRERDERSYVRGAYGRLHDAQNQRGTVQYLRDKDAYTVLLAQFANCRLGQELTLAQVFTWGREEELKKIYIVATCGLSILEHFQLNEGIDSLRKRLRSLDAEVYEEWGRYSQQLIKHFGLRSEKALDLFNQTVAIKEIGGLNEFVRQHMLEKGSAQTTIRQLRENYQNLTEAHDAIVRAETQLTRLRPLMQSAEQFQQLQARIKETEQALETVPRYFAHMKLGLLNKAILDCERDLEFAQDKRAGVTAQLERLRGQERELYAAIKNDQVGQRLAELDRDIAELGERLQKSRQRFAAYMDLAQKLNSTDFAAPVSESVFYANRTTLLAARPKIDEQLQYAVLKRDQQKQEETRLDQATHVLRTEITALQGRASRIPGEDLRIRAQLVAALQLEEDALPFVGELLKVRSEAHEWEGAIERLLRGYARQLLVSDELYPAISAYVDRTNLRGRLVYQRVGERRSGRSISDPDQQLLINKLEIKPQTRFHEWLWGDLIEHWDYVCCATLEQFQKERRALTINGQIRRGGARHEKDDRFALNDTTQYVLGWDNRAKLAALRRELAKEEQRLQGARNQIDTIERDQRLWEQRKVSLGYLLQFEHFAELDWQSLEVQLTQRQADRNALATSTDHIQQLQGQLDAVQAAISQVHGEEVRVQQIIGMYESDLRRYRGQRTPELTRMGQELRQYYEPQMRIESDLKKDPKPTLDSIDSVQRKLEQYYTNSLNSLRSNNQRNRDAIITQMTEFRRDYPIESNELDASIEAIGAFRQLLERIERDDLPTYQRRFKEWLNDKVLESLIGFQGTLWREAETFREAITTLNSSLQRIDYTPATYIRLRADNTRDSEIRDFQQQLRNCFPDSGLRTVETNQTSFQRIRELIERFEQDERWTQRVTDVRNWLDFAAEERYRADDSEKSFYSDSSGKSGGQKAKLAYTILASAIAYQYKLDQPTNRRRAFRFVVVDEAFSKSDEANARYAMKLFQQLELQLLVVTPLDKTHVVEPYIEACHFVRNNQEENNSQLWNLTFQEYREQKANVASASVVMTED
jgi:uncharacterized protein YPO0396